MMQWGRGGLLPVAVGTWDLGLGREDLKLIQPAAVETAFKL